MSKKLTISNQKLTKKQQLFADEYLKDLNATRAAIAAGYSERTAREMGSENLTKPHISQYIASRQKKNEAAVHMSQKTWLGELIDMINTNVGEIYDYNGGEFTFKDEIPERAMKNIKKVTKKIKSWQDKEGNLHTETNIMLEMYPRDGAIKTLGQALGYLALKEKANPEREDTGNTYYNQINIAMGSLPKPE